MSFGRKLNFTITVYCNPYRRYLSPNFGGRYKGNRYKGAARIARIYKLLQALLARTGAHSYIYVRSRIFSG